MTGVLLFGPAGFGRWHDALKRWRGFGGQKGRALRRAVEVAPAALQRSDIAARFADFGFRTIELRSCERDIAAGR